MFIMAYRATTFPTSTPNFFFGLTAKNVIRKEGKQVKEISCFLFVQESLLFLYTFKLYVNQSIKTWEK